MRIEIELHEAQSGDGETVRVRIVREWRDYLDQGGLNQGGLEQGGLNQGGLNQGGLGDRSVTLVRDHDKGTDLSAGEEEDEFLDPDGKRYRLVRRIA